MKSDGAISFAISLDPVHWAEGIASKVSGFGLSLIAPWVLDGTKGALEQVANLINGATSPNVESTWFSGEYWRIAALASMLTVPFVFAAVLQALLRSEPGLLGKVVFAYLPLSVLGVSLAAPMITLLLSATDEMCSLVSGSAVTGGATFLAQAAAATQIGSLNGSPFLAVIVGLFTLAAALMLSIELMIREAAVYVVVLMLPLAFSAFVWPARRIWAIRLIELLVSLILAKFVIVSVLSLAGAAWTSGQGVSSLLTAMSLLLLSVFAPWALMRLLPFTEVAAAAAGTMHQEMSRGGQQIARLADKAPGGSEDSSGSMAERLRAYAQDAGGARGTGGDDAGGGSSNSGASATGAGQYGSQSGSGGDQHSLPAASDDLEGAASGGGIGAIGGGTAGAGSSASETAGAAAIVGDASPASRNGSGADAPTGDGDLGLTASGSGDSVAETSGAPAGGGAGEQMDPALMAEDNAWPPMNLGPGGWGGPVDYRNQQAAAQAATADDDGAPFDPPPALLAPADPTETFAPESELPAGDDLPYLDEEA